MVLLQKTTKEDIDIFYSWQIDPLTRKYFHNNSIPTYFEHCEWMKKTFDISAYTVAERPFFRKESNLIMEFEGNVRAGFRSDVKSFSVNNGRKCVNLYRLGYPTEGKDNLCSDLENDCNGELETSLWNEFIATPLRILGTSKG